MRTKEIAPQSPVEKMTRTDEICYLLSDRLRVVHMHTNIYIYIYSIPSASSHHKLEVLLSKLGHWFMFVYYHLTYVEILSCSALAEIRNLLKQVLT